MVRTSLVFICFPGCLGVLAIADFRKWREEIFLKGSSVTSQRWGQSFWDFSTYSVSLEDDALPRMGVQVAYLLNGPGALYFLRCIIFMKNVLTKSVFSCPH